MTVRPISALPADPELERRARIRARLIQLGEGAAAIFHDLCLLLDEDLGLEARPMLVNHLVARYCCPARRTPPTRNPSRSRLSTLWSRRFGLRGMPAWLHPLNSVKAFSNPPAPEVDGDAGRVSVLRWPASAYLERV